MAYKARLTVYAEPRQIDQLKALAFKRDTSLSDYILGLIDDHLDRMRRAEVALRRKTAPATITHTSDAAPLPGQPSLLSAEPDGGPSDA